jgi:hypothetical protein
MTIDQDVWFQGELADGLRSRAVSVRFDRIRPSEDDPERTSGVLSSLDELPVGKALTLRLQDGRRALVVVVDRRGRFLTSGPVWRAN